MGVRLVVRSPGAGDAPEFRYSFDQERIVIGRSAGADVCLPAPAVSAKHATITSTSGGPAVEDGSSTNGTYVNGERLPPGRPKRLQNGDVLHCGGFDIVFEGPLPLVELTSEGRTSSLARRIVREAMGNEAPVAAPALTVTAGPDVGLSLTLPLPPARLTVGRGEECDLVLADADVSREHVEVIVDLDGFELRDLQSKNGMTVGGRAMPERRLRSGDVIRLGGPTELTFVDPADTVMQELLRREDEAAPPPARPAPATPPPESDSDQGRGDPSTPGAEAPSEGAPEAPSPAAPRSGMGGADVVIYLLAAAVLTLSIVALVFLLQDG